MSVKRKKIAKEELKKCTSHLEDIFSTYLSDRGKDPQEGGIAESWIYEMSAGEDVVVESAVKLLEKKDAGAFFRIAEVMAVLRLAMCDIVLNRMLANDKIETEKRVCAAEMLIKGWRADFNGIPENIRKIITFKNDFLQIAHENAAEKIEGMKAVIKNLGSEEMSAGLLFAMKESDFAGFSTSAEKLLNISPAFEKIIISIISDEASGKGIPLLEKIFVQTEKKDIRKEINRAVYRLKKKGIEFDEDKFKEERKNPLAGGTVESEGYVSAMFEGGDIQFVIFYIHHSVKGYRLFNFLKSVREGLADFSVNKVSKNEIKKYLNHITNVRNTPLFKVSAEHCRFLLDESVKVTKEKGGELNRHYDKWKDYIEEHIAPSDKSSVYALFNGNELGKKPVARILDDMKGEELLALSFINNEELSQLYERFNDIDESGIVLKEYQKDEMRKEKLAGIANDFFGKSYRRLIVRKLEDLSLLLYLSDKKEESEKFLRLAIDADSADKPSDSAFLSHLLYSYFENYSNMRDNKVEDIDNSAQTLNTFEKEG